VIEAPFLAQGATNSIQAHVVDVAIEVEERTSRSGTTPPTIVAYPGSPRGQDVQPAPLTRVA